MGQRTALGQVPWVAVRLDASVAVRLRRCQGGDHHHLEHGSRRRKHPRQGDGADEGEAADDSGVDGDGGGAKA
eukprot:10511633-Lingulodinium_polyedra.AAC.1